MPTKILIGADEPRLWEKLEAMIAIDPATSGGIENIVLGRRPVTSADPLQSLFKTGYEEIHQIDAGFCTHIADAHIERDWRLTAISTDANLRLRVAFAGEAHYWMRGNQVSDESLRCSFVIRPAREALTVNFKGGTDYRYCSLNVTQDYLQKTLGLEQGDLPATLLTHWTKQETVMGHFTLSKNSLAQAARFFKLKSTGTWRDIEVRTISVDLLRLLFDDWRKARRGTRASIRITPEERDKLMRIRDMLEADPVADVTLPALCAKMRLNRNKLHNGFKRMFGVSVHDYRMELRMRIAKQLLETTQLPISEVAERSGFSEPTNFTAAFKKHFAALPSQMR